MVIAVTNLASYTCYYNVSTQSPELLETNALLSFFYFYVRHHQHNCTLPLNSDTHIYYHFRFQDDYSFHTYERDCAEYKLQPQITSLTFLPELQSAVNMQRETEKNEGFTNKLSKWNQKCDIATALYCIFTTIHVPAKIQTFPKM